MTTNAINWFEIPATDLARAKEFYSTVMAVELQEMKNGPMQMGMFPADEGGVSGAIAQADGMVPSQQGSIVYLNGGDDLSGPLSRVEGAGGKVLQAKMDIGEHGFIAYFEDTEGNRVGLHSMG